MFPHKASSGPPLPRAPPSPQAPSRRGCAASHLAVGLYALASCVTHLSSSE